MSAIRNPERLWVRNQEKGGNEAFLSPPAPHGFQRTYLSATFSVLVEGRLPPIRLPVSPAATVPWS